MRDFRVTVRSLWAALRHNWPWKVAALAVALLIFLGVRRSTSYTQTLALPVEVVSEESGTFIPSVSPGVVDVTFRGSETAIRQLSLSGVELPRVRVHLSLPETGKLTTKVRLSRSDVTCPTGLRVDAIEQTELEVTFSPSETRSFRIAQPEVIGVPAFCEARVYIKPETVMVSGPGALFDEIDVNRPLRTELIDITNLSGYKTDNLRVLPPDERSGWTVRPDRVRAEVVIQRENGTRSFPEVPVKVLQSESGRRYVPDARTVEVEAHGVSSELSTINARGIVALVGEAQCDEALICEPQIVFPSSNRVNRVTVRPSKIRLFPEQPAQEGLP